MPFGVRIYTKATTTSTTVTTKENYYHTDHLGSIIAITDQTGAVVERRSYDAWGKRRNQNGTAMSNAFITSEVRHAFTGHEDLGELGLIHMNGRLYDPALGRFLSADPTVQFPSNMQNYNRYTYINNNPLSAVDYSGYGFIDEFFGELGATFNSLTGGNRVVRMAAIIAISTFAPGIFGATFNIVLDSMQAAMVGGFAAGAASGGSLSSALKGALVAGAMSWAGGIKNVYARYAAHGAIGCASASADGGKCGAGAMAGVFSAATEKFASGFGKYGGAVVSAVIGGTASVIGGGKFENGAMTGAFGYLFNCMAHPLQCGGGKESSNWADAREHYRYGSGEPVYVNVRTIDFSGVTDTGWDQYGNKTFTFSGSDYTVYGTVTLHRINEREFQVLPDPQNNNVRWSEGPTFRNLATAANAVAFFLPLPNQYSGSYEFHFVGIRRFDQLNKFDR